MDHLEAILQVTRIRSYVAFYISLLRGIRHNLYFGMNRLESFQIEFNNHPEMPLLRFVLMTFCYVISLCITFLLIFLRQRLIDTGSFVEQALTTLQHPQFSDLLDDMLIRHLSDISVASGLTLSSENIRILSNCLVFGEDIESLSVQLRNILPVYFVPSYNPQPSSLDINLSRDILDSSNRLSSTNHNDNTESPISSLLPSPVSHSMHPLTPPSSDVQYLRGIPETGILIHNDSVDPRPHGLSLNESTSAELPFSSSSSLTDLSTASSPPAPNSRLIPALCSGHRSSGLFRMVGSNRRRRVERNLAFRSPEAVDIVEPRSRSRSSDRFVIGNVISASPPSVSSGSEAEAVIDEASNG
jgi:hypothetical protein